MGALFRFLDLPPELRLTTYGFIFNNTNIVFRPAHNFVRRRNRHSGHTRDLARNHTVTTLPAILLTSKNTYYEAITTYWRNAGVWLTCWVFVEWSLPGFCAQISAAARANISHIRGQSMNELHRLPAVHVRLFLAQFPRLTTFRAFAALGIRQAHQEANAGNTSSEALYRLAMRQYATENEQVEGEGQGEGVVDPRSIVRGFGLDPDTCGVEFQLRLWLFREYGRRSIHHCHVNCNTGNRMVTKVRYTSPQHDEEDADIWAQLRGEYRGLVEPEERKKKNGGSSQHIAVSAHDDGYGSICRAVVDIARAPLSLILPVELDEADPAAEEKVSSAGALTSSRPPRDIGGLFRSSS
ncbi:hypothetical protein F5Y15DRAFT_429245 [Xylariaceae sp. FL0016]|nr:hypothetical protein F5Y15DRAFT_429245 [Xylariaceae sp. FL0016]